jgi:hypothetical protein
LLLPDDAPRLALGTITGPSNVQTPRRDPPACPNFGKDIYGEAEPLAGQGAKQRHTITFANDRTRDPRWHNPIEKLDGRVAVGVLRQQRRPARAIHCRNCYLHRLEEGLDRQIFGAWAGGRLASVEQGRAEDKQKQQEEAVQNNSS